MTAVRMRTYAEAILEATEQAMHGDSRVVVMGQGVDDAKGTLGTTRGLKELFGPDRVSDTPLSEDGMTGIAIGMALGGLRPIHVHIRMDFLLLAMNQIVNMAAKKHYMTGGQERVPLVIRSIIGKSWGQGAQHSQALHSLFMHVPGIRVAAPATPYDAKGVLLWSVRDDNPVLVVEHRLLYGTNGPVPEAPYLMPPGSARVVRPGNDVTLVGVSYMLQEALRAACYLEEAGISAEVMDPVWLSPLDLDGISASVARTGRLHVVDNAWPTCGAASEIIAGVVERVQGLRVVRVSRSTFAAVPCPPSPGLEALFYPNAISIAASVYRLVRGGTSGWVPTERPEFRDVMFRGPF